MLFVVSLTIWVRVDGGLTAGQSSKQARKSERASAPGENLSRGSPPAAGLRLWLRADLGVRPDRDNRVSAWANQAGEDGGAKQPEVAARPLLVVEAVNGKPAVRFDGVDDFLRGSMGELVAPLTLFAVARFGWPSQPDGDFDYIINIGYILEAGRHVNIARWGTKVPEDINRNRYYSVYDSVKHVDLFGPILPGEVYLVMTVMHGTTPPRHRLYLNSTAQEVRDSPSSVRLNGNYTLGKVEHPARFHGLKGEIAEILVYDRALPDRERQMVENYLKVRYSIP